MQKLGPQPKNSRQVYQFDLVDSNTGQPLTNVYTGTETLQASLWAGRSGATLATPAAAWLSGPNGQIQVTVAPADLAALAPGLYRLQVLINPATDAVPAVDCLLIVADAPGSDPARPVYGDVKDLLDRAPWLNRVGGEEDLADFAAERAAARSEIDGIILNRYKALRWAPQIGQPGFGSWMDRARYLDQPLSPWLRQQLQANLLMQTDELKRLAALKALAIACLGQIGADDKADATWLRRAEVYEWQFQNSIKTYRAEIDLNGDGYPEITVNCGATDVR